MSVRFIYYIHALLCPLTNKIRHVGQSKKVVERYWQRSQRIIIVQSGFELSGTVKSFDSFPHFIII